ncbi:MAG: helix-turn-helix domain-containing protein [Kangiellaceae bacterium]|nr:helix-turn-helix domain-containing protein [Kangiellaceae bacterium]
MLVKKLRLQRGWSQEQLADISGLSTRTIQRLERGENASLETLKSLASVFEIDVSELSQHYLINSAEEPIMQHDTQLTYEEAKAIEQVKELRGFYIHLLIFLVMIPAAWIFNLTATPKVLWAIWPTLGWGVGLIGHAIGVLDIPFIFGAEWEKKQVEKRLGRKL